MYRVPFDKSNVSKITTTFVANEKGVLELVVTGVVLTPKMHDWMHMHMKGNFEIQKSMSPTYIDFDTDGDAVTYRLNFI